MTVTRFQKIWHAAIYTNRKIKALSLRKTALYHKLVKTESSGSTEYLTIGRKIYLVRKPTVGRSSADSYRPSASRFIGELFFNLGNCKEQLSSVDCWPTVGQLSLDSRPTVGQQSTDYRPTVDCQTAATSGLA